MDNIPPVVMKFQNYPFPYIVTNSDLGAGDHFFFFHFSPKPLAQFWSPNIFAVLIVTSLNFIGTIRSFCFVFCIFILNYNPSFIIRK